VFYIVYYIANDKLFILVKMNHLDCYFDILFYASILAKLLATNLIDEFFFTELQYSILHSVDLDSLISQALLIGDYESAVELCLHGGRMADAIVMASAGGPVLLEKTQKRYFASSNAKMIHVS